MIRKPVYLDHNASTPPHSAVVEAMLPWLGHKHANPHSDHQPGRQAALAVEEAKESVARLIGAAADEIVLTSGATEASNLALQGYLLGHGDTSALIHSSIEHPCVAEVARFLARKGTRVEGLNVDRNGVIDPLAIGAAVAAASRPRTLVSVIHASNEIGTVQRVAPLAAKAHGCGAAFHLDASQSLGWIEIDVADGIDFATLSSHKIGGPVGIGALYVADGLGPELTPLTYGGGQQHGLRPGTVPVFLAVGFGAACDLVSSHRAERAQAAEVAADAFMTVLRDGGVAFEIMGCPDARLPGLRSVRLPGIEARDLLDRLQTTVSASASSACASGDYQASHVLRAIGLSETDAMQVVRFGFGASTSIEEASEAARCVNEALDAIRRRPHTESEFA